MNDPHTVVGAPAASPHVHHGRHTRNNRKSVFVTQGLHRQSRFREKYRKQAEEYDKKCHESLGTTSAFDAECRSRFYEVYHKHSQEYDRGFAKKYDDDLDTTLLFAGLFSAVASAFILNIQPELQPGYGEQTVELLKTLIHTVNNPTPGATPEFPRWLGPSEAIIQVQSILYLSLGAALFSAFLAVLGKQWLNRYAVGSVADRSHHRQRKLDGMAVWYFSVFMQSLPFMLQVALLLLGCALSLHLWELQPTVSRVVIGVTSLGVVLYLFIVVAGTLYTSCPYQTPASQIIRHVSRLSKQLRPLINNTYSFGDAWDWGDR